MDRQVRSVRYDDPVDIRQIRLFCRIVDRRSFSLAAEELLITQPAASQQVQSLERELQTILLDRSRRTVTPTDTGSVLYRYGREILDLHERTCTEIQNLGELVAGRLVVGASTGPGEHVLPAMLTSFKAEYPGVAISLHVDDTHTVVERVLAREFEVGAVGAVAPRPDLVAEPLARDEVVLVCGATHPWATRTSVRLAEVVREPQIVQQHGAGVRVCGRGSPALPRRAAREAERRHGDGPHGVGQAGSHRRRRSDLRQPLGDRTGGRARRPRRRAHRWSAHPARLLHGALQDARALACRRGSP